MFPEEEMLGVDLVIPDVTYIRENRKKLRAIFLTHGHEDHTGALPYFLRKIQRADLQHAADRRPRSASSSRSIACSQSTDLRDRQARRDVSKAGVFDGRVLPGRPQHPGLRAATPSGRPSAPCIHTGDFKLDHTPVMGQLTDLVRLAAAGRRGRACCSAPTRPTPRCRATRPVRTGRRRGADATSCRSAEGRVIVATFASLISRVQQVDRCRRRHGPQGLRHRPQHDGQRPDGARAGLPQRSRASMIVERRRDAQHAARAGSSIITTGSQGEPTSAPSRAWRTATTSTSQIVEGRHGRPLGVADPRQRVGRLPHVDNLFRLGADVLYNRIAEHARARPRRRRRS